MATNRMASESMLLLFSRACENNNMCLGDFDFTAALVQVAHESTFVIIYVALAVAALELGLMILHLDHGLVLYCGALYTHKVMQQHENHSENMIFSKVLYSMTVCTIVLTWPWE